ncbi:MAG: PIN domain nuclease [Thermoprotei archaeon]|nr:MAG: PIN domain nuclease [Thermoprotei archaeon]
MRQKRSRRFLLDTNIFIAAFKSGWTKTTELLLELLTNPKYELVGNSVLLEEYKKWTIKLGMKDSALQEPATILYSLLKSKIKLVKPDKKHLEVCKPYFPESERADLYHAATCLKTGAILISNDKHFDKIKQAGLIPVWRTGEAIRKILKHSKR